jgi:hypothetical protein
MATVIKGRVRALSPHFRAIDGGTKNPDNHGCQDFCVFIDRGVCIEKDCVRI